VSWVTDLWDSITKEFKPAPAAPVKSPCTPECEKKIRDEIIAGMRLANRRPGGIDYGESLDPAYWDSKGGLQWQLKSRAKPSEAVERIFELNAASNMECLSVMSAIYYRAILKNCGADKFNKMFAGGKDLEISQNSPVLSKYVKQKPASDPIQAGDWVYISGHPKYDSSEMDSVLGANWGAWRGENAVSNGDGTYSGLGLDGQTETVMSDELFDNYNNKVHVYNDHRPSTPYTVKTGETLQAIAAKSGVTVEDLKETNVAVLKTWPAADGSGRQIEGFNAGETIVIPSVPRMPLGTRSEMPGIDPDSRYAPDCAAICPCGGS
jgi:LysM repeat protein